MSDKIRQSLVRSLHQSTTEMCIAAAGGGSFFISNVLTEPGASHTVLEAVVPYSTESLSRYIGRVPEQHCCPRTARYMAMTAFYRALRFVQSRKAGAVQDFVNGTETRRTLDVSHENNEVRLYTSTDWMNQGDLEDYRHLIGVGCTASLATNREKKGEYRVHVALQTLRRTVLFSLQLNKNTRRSRYEEEVLVADLILNAVETVRQEIERPLATEPVEQDFCTFGTGTTDNFPLNEFLPLNLGADETVHGRQVIGSPPLIDTFFGKSLAVLWRNGKITHLKPREDLPAVPTAAYNPQAEFTQAVFPGSFNPIHQGHLKMLALAEEQLGSKVSLEISVCNVDKPPLDYIELEYRLNEIQNARPGQAVWLTQTPLFEDKANLFHGTTFTVGADTLRRFADLRFYHESTHQLHDVLRMIAFYNCRFLVFARNNQGTLESLTTLDIPDMLRSLCDEIPASQFAMDISSSDIRRREI
ncbi:MAG: hypothetical protein LBN39_06175 [Planctomycetaceae bacterium]|jgi:nicotinic acid mononucleotide adenylyltransferase|nr:hypothetical protein [Planctomycetaceae bacterium]